MAWCCTLSLCSSCCCGLLKCFQFCPDNKPQNLGRTGTTCSFFLISISVIVSIICQRYTEYIKVDAWDDGCDDLEFNSVCKSNSAVFRISFALVIFFVVQMVVCYFTAYFYDRFWPFKLPSFIALVIGFYFASSNVFDARGYAWFARFAGFAFLILQQIILIDLAHIWNEKWVSYSMSQDNQGNNCYLIGLVVISLFMYAGAIVALIFMFNTFDCAENEVILSLTVIFSFLATFYQLFLTSRGSLLTSAIMVLYSTYICFSSISLNPRAMCNPTLGTSSQNWSQVMGMALTAISLSWTTYSVISKITADGIKDHPELGVSLPVPVSALESGAQNTSTQQAKVSNNTTSQPSSNAAVSSPRAVTYTDVASNDKPNTSDPYRCCCYELTGDEVDTPERRGLFAHISFVYLLISAYYAMVKKIKKIKSTHF